MNILISRPDKIGDVVLALHGAKQLKKILPNSKICMHIAEYTKDLVSNIKFIDSYITTEQAIKDIQFDCFVDLMAKHKTSKLFKANNIPVRIGNAARWFRFNYNTRAYIRRSKALINEAEYNWRLIRLVHKDLKNTNLYESLTKEDFKEIKAQNEISNHLVLMPSLAVSARGWSKEKWLELANLYVNKYDGARALIMLGPAEKELFSFYQESIKSNDRIIVKQPQSIRESLGYLENAVHYVGLSSGISHLASALNIPGVALYPESKSMHPSRWLPFNSSLGVISLDRKPVPEDIIISLSTKVPDRLNPLKREPLSSFIICKNEEKNIERCLKSLSWCDEILVVDSGSKDRTLEIAKKYTNKIITRNWEGHKEQKHFALKNCSHPWVLSLDADEEVSMELKGLILDLLRKPKKLNKYNGFDILRVVYYLNQWWDRGGWHPEYRTRLVKKDYTNWGGINPHDKAIVSGRIGKLSEPIYHFTYSDIQHQIESLNKHSSAAAIQLYRAGKKAYAYNVLLNPAFRFFKFYVLKLGFKQGYSGLLVGLIEASYTFFKYVKLWELGKKQKVKSN